VRTFSAPQRTGRLSRALFQQQEENCGGWPADLGDVLPVTKIKMKLLSATKPAAHQWLILLAHGWYFTLNNLQLVLECSDIIAVSTAVVRLFKV
jgi:hypothetical protein